MTSIQLIIKVFLDPSFLILMLVVLFLFPLIFFAASLKPPKNRASYKVESEKSKKKKKPSGAQPAENRAGDANQKSEKT